MTDIASVGAAVSDPFVCLSAPSFYCAVEPSEMHPKPFDLLCLDAFSGHVKTIEQTLKMSAAEHARRTAPKTVFVALQSLALLPSVDAPP